MGQQDRPVSNGIPLNVLIELDLRLLRNLQPRNRGKRKKAEKFVEYQNGTSPEEKMSSPTAINKTA